MACNRVGESFFFILFDGHRLWGRECRGSGRRNSLPGDDRIDNHGSDSDRDTGFLGTERATASCYMEILQTYILISQNMLYNTSILTQRRLHNMNRDESLVDLFKQFLTSKFVTFSGRASRREYWGSILMLYVSASGLLIVGEIIGAIVGGGSGLGSVLCILFFLYTLVPSLALTVRRLHDTNRSGEMLLLAFIPIVGGIILLVFYLSQGTLGDNDYGPDPYGQLANTDANN